MLFDDFISANHEAEFKKARKIDTRNIVFSDPSQEFNEADFADIGNELEFSDVSQSSLADKIRQFS